MIDGKKVSGTSRYYQEYLFFRAIEETKARLGEVIMVSEAKRLRTAVDNEIAREAPGKSIGGAGVTSNDVAHAIDAVFGAEVDGYKPIFSADNLSKNLKSYTDDFRGLLGMSGTAGPNGPRLPISPYDPRWSGRGTIKQSGSGLLFITEDDVEAYAGNNLKGLVDYTGTELMLKGVNGRGTMYEAGQSVSVDDLSGMTNFMDYMSPGDWREAKRWVEAGAMSANNVLDTNKFMTQEAMSRAMAVLNDLSSRGVPFRITPDKNPGQLRASIEGSRLSVRVMETRKEEGYVGHRIYNDGASIYYTTSNASMGQVFGSSVDPAKVNQHSAPNVTPEMCVDILRYAQGLPVMRRDLTGELVGSNTTYRVGKNQVRSSYHTQKTSSFAYDNVSDAGGRLINGGKVIIHRDSENRSPRFTRRGEESSVAYLEEAVDSARENLSSAIDAEGIIAFYEANPEAAAAGEVFPDFSGDIEIAAVQRTYWDVLRGEQGTLLRPNATVEEYEDLIGAIGHEVLTEEEFNELQIERGVDAVAYVGSPVDMVRAHAADVPQGMIGSYEQHTIKNIEGVEEIKRFNPVRVAKYMTSEHSLFRNNDDMVWAMKEAGIGTEELLGSSVYADSVKNAMVEFDVNSSVDVHNHPNAFVRDMGVLVEDTINRNGAEAVEVRVDDQGIVQWRAKRFNRTDGSYRDVAGEIGQIFGYGEKGTITTNFGSGDNYAFVPGYEARIATQLPGEAKTVEERTVLRGYEQIMAEQVQYQIANDVSMKLSSATNDVNRVGDATSLNGVYRRVYDVRHDVDFLKLSREEGMQDSLRDAILATEARRVRFDNDIRDGSTANAEYRASRGQAGDPANDNFGDAWALTGGRNMAIMGGETSKGYFDDVMTSGSTNQGITRYLVESAKVGQDGRILRGDLNDRTPLAKHESLALMRFDPVDRQQMTFANLLKARQVTSPTGVAMRPLGGWNFDDGFVISQEFADKHSLRGADGDLRPLQVGDKLSDLHGNKGVISLVVDREMSAEAAVEEDIEEARELFAANKNLDVVISPFSAVSRFNGGSARELMESPEDLVGGVGGTVENGMGYAQLIVTDHVSDKKTNIYGEEELAQGRGRRASAQLAWALGAQGADQVMEEFYGGNTSAISNFREMLVTMGMDMAPDGKLVEGNWNPEAEGIYGDEYSKRRVFKQPDLILNASGGVNGNAMRMTFGKVIGDKGGDLELPFPLYYPQATPGDPRRQIPKGADGTYLLPVMSAHLRSGQELEDGSTTSHEYTNRYMGIYDAAFRYRAAKERLANIDNGTLDAPSAQVMQSLKNTVANSQRMAQDNYDAISASLKERHFSGKRNMFKESLMSSRLPHSATAVWTADPRLDVDQVAMSSGMAEQLGFKADDYALVWRDPVLRDSGVRYMRVAIDDRLTGISINPVMDKSFDGDFDGDAVAVVRLTSREAREQASKLLTVEANLLDLGTMNYAVDSQTGEVDLDPETGLPMPADAPHPLNIQDSLDVKVAQHVNPELKSRFEALTQTANDAYYDFNNPEPSEKTGKIAPEHVRREAFLQTNRALVKELSSYYHDALNEPGIAQQATLQFGDQESHVESVRAACIETGAKGSEAKLGTYQRYAGINPETGDMGDDTLATREEAEGVWFALQAKAFGTGVAGAYSQRGVKVGRNAALRPILELTYPVTQSMLQAKHDPEEARHKYEMLMGPARDLWKGRQLHRGEHGWEALRDDKNNMVQASKANWTKTFYDFYTSSDGLNVNINPEHILTVSEVLSQDGVMLDMEDSVALARSGKGDLGSTMDRLAYGGNYTDLVNFSREGKNIFEGTQNGHFAPSVVRKNQMETRHAEAGLIMDPKYTEIGDKSVLENGATKGEKRRIAEARTVRKPRFVKSEPIVANDTAPDLGKVVEYYDAKGMENPSSGPELG